MAFKSEIHVAELASIRTGHTEGDIYYILDNGMLGDLPCKPGTFVKWHNNTWQIQPNEHYALASAVDTIEEQIEDIGQPLQWKGPAAVAQLNAGITGIQPGWTYTLTDAGTLTDGSVKVDVGDEVAWTEDGEWFKLGGDSSKITVFEAGERFTNFPTFAQIKAEIAKGKTVVIKTSDDEMWYLIRSNSVYCWFQGASEWFTIRVDDSNNWTTPYQYDSSLNSQSHNAVQNSALYDIIGNVETLLAAL